MAELEEQKASLIEENAGYEKIRDDLEGQISDMDEEIYEKNKRKEEAEEQAVRAEQKARAVQKELSALTADMKRVEQYAAKYVHSPEEWLPEPNAMETAKSYRKRILPAFGKVVELLRPLYAAYTKLKENCGHLTERVTSLTKQVENLSGRLTRSNNENQELRGKLIDFDRIRKVLGDEVVDDAIREAKILEREQEIARKRKRQYSRDAR